MQCDSDKFEYIISVVLDKVAQKTKTPRDILHKNTMLANVGVDSLAAVLICGHLEDEFQLEIEPSLMFQYKTAEQVATALIKMMSEQ